MHYLARFIIVLVTVLTVSVPGAMGQTCAQLKAEIATLQTTLANEQHALDNCNNHLGSCTAGQISSYQQAIQTAQQEIQADQAQLPLVCAPPPPPHTDHVSLQGIEVVQAIQDDANSVTLVAGKTTWVRVYFDKNNGTRQITGKLQAQQAGTTVSLSPVASITVDASESLKTRRSNWSKTLNFAVPASVTKSGTTVFTLTAVSDPSASPATIVCANCTNPTQVDFFNSPALVVRAIGISYTFTSGGGPPQTATPRAADFQLLQSWLGRAYPVSTVTFSQTTVASTNTWPFSCGQANTQLSAIRAVDVANGTDGHTHYYGLVPNQGGYMRGCAAGIPGKADPSVTASGPTGPTSGGVAPVNVSGDNDASFGDWYGGHELGHTFGRAHPGFCNGNSKDDTSFPYPNGQLSDGTDASYVGLDVGDTGNSIKLAVLWGGSDFDIMTYCNQPQWLSAYTYTAVRQRLLDENPGFKEMILRPQGLPPAGAQLVHVVARVNLTRRTGTIDSVTPLTSTLQPQIGPTGRAVLVVRDTGGRELSRHEVTLRLLTDIPPNEDQIAVVEATLPFRPDMAEVDLVLDNAVLARYKNAQTTPPAVSGLKAARAFDSAAPTVTWDQPPASAGQVTFIVQIPGPNDRWEAIAVGLAANKLTLPAAHAKTSRLRVIATNGFRSSPPIVFNLCPELMDQVAKLENEIQNLQQALNSGEVAVRPGGQQRAQIEAQLANLRRELAAARTRLAQCQEQKQ